MEFLHDPIWWFATAVCAVTASMPSLMHSIGKTKLFTVTVLWLAGSATAILRSGLLPGLAVMAGSGLLGILLLAGSLIFSGIRSMPNQRFEER
jgi:hypothetical protein